MKRVEILLEKLIKNSKNPTVEIFRVVEDEEFKKIPFKDRKKYLTEELLNFKNERVKNLIAETINFKRVTAIPNENITLKQILLDKDKGGYSALETAFYWRGIANYNLTFLEHVLGTNPNTTPKKVIKNKEALWMLEDIIDSMEIEMIHDDIVMWINEFYNRVLAVKNLKEEKGITL